MPLHFTSLQSDFYPAPSNLLFLAFSTTTSIPGDLAGQDGEGSGSAATGPDARGVDVLGVAVRGIHPGRIDTREVDADIGASSATGTNARRTNVGDAIAGQDTPSILEDNTQSPGYGSSVSGSSKAHTSRDFQDHEQEAEFLQNTYKYLDDARVLPPALERAPAIIEDSERSSNCDWVDVYDSSSDTEDSLEGRPKCPEQGRKAPIENGGVGYDFDDDVLPMDLLEFITMRKGQPSSSFRRRLSSPSLTLRSWPCMVGEFELI